MIAETSDAISDAMAEEAYRQLERRRLDAILHETDRLLWLLEGMNLDSLKTISEGVAMAVQAACIAASGHDHWSLRQHTQDALDDVLEAQEALLRRHCAGP